MREYPLKEDGVDADEIFRGFSEEHRKGLKDAIRSISQAFNWNLSAEGDVFWRDVVSRLQEISEMPDPLLKARERPFKPGDRVVCVDAGGSGLGTLKKNRTYTIESLVRLADGRAGVTVKENCASWLATRFRHADQVLPAMWLGADAFPEEKAA